MTKHTAWILLVILSLALTLSAQETAQIIPGKSTSVRAGEEISFSIKLDRAPNFGGGTISFVIGPKDAGSRTPDISTNTAVASDQDKLRLGFLIPVKLPGERWHIKKLAFTIPGSAEKPIAFTDVEFQVLEAKKLIAPEAATVEIAK